MSKSKDVAVGDGLTLEVNKWQNPVLYILYQIYVRTYFVDSAGDMWAMDQLQNFPVDLSNAEPKQTLVLTVADSAFTLSSGSASPLVSTHGDLTTLSMTYVQERGYDENRIFELLMPKDPNHYIKEGFVPLSSHPDVDPDNTSTQYDLLYDVYWRRIVPAPNAESWANTYPSYHPYAGQRVCLNNCAVKGRNGITDETKGAERVAGTGWNSDTVRIFLNNPQKLTLDGDGSGGYYNEEYKFVIYPYKVPPSSKKDTTWSSTFNVHSKDVSGTVIYNAYIVKEFVKAFSAQTDAGLFTSTQKTLTNPTVATYFAKGIVRGQELLAQTVTTTGPTATHSMNLYSNAEIEFKFVVHNPII